MVIDSVYNLIFNLDDMKLGVITALHNRHDMTLVFLSSMRRIHEKFGVSTHAVVTEGDPIISSLEGIDYITHRNKPLGAKWNAISQHMKDSDLTHFLIMGSDDIPSDAFIEHALTLGEYDISGVQGIWFWGLNPIRAGFNKFGFYYTSSIIGAGKIVSRRVMEMCDWKPWPPYEGGGLDGKMMKIISDYSFSKGISISIHKYSLLETGGFIVDVKYEDHISSMSPIIRRNFTEYEYKAVIYEHLPDEAEALFALRDKVNN